MIRHREWMVRMVVAGAMACATGAAGCSSASPTAPGAATGVPDAAGAASVPHAAGVPDAGSASVARPVLTLKGGAR
jgi:hypothetical protein